MRSGGFFDYDAKRERLEEVERELENPDIWNNPERAQALGRERSMLDKTVNGLRELKEGLAGGDELLDLAEMEDDEDTALAVVAATVSLIGRVEVVVFTLASNETSVRCVGTFSRDIGRRQRDHSS